MAEVSVIIGVYNKGRFIKETIESVLSQTFKDFELIIVDDCSKDNSARIIKDYAKKDKRIKFIQNRHNLGSTKSRNVALKAASGKYIAVLDADDVMLPKRLEIQHKFLEKHKNIFLVGSSAIVIDENGKKIGHFWKYHRFPWIVNLRLNRLSVFVHSSVMYRNDGMLYNEEYKRGEDPEFYLRARRENKNMVNLFRPLVKYRIDPGGIMATKTLKNDPYAQKLRREYVK